MRQKITAYVLCLGFFVSFVSFVLLPLESCNATEDSLYKNVLDAAALYETMVQLEYENCLKNIEKDIAKNGWNYTYTMDTLLGQEDIYSGIDMDEIIAALCMAAGNKTTLNVAEIKTLSMSEEEQNVESCIPVKRTRFLENSDGSYVPDGICYITTAGYYDTYVETENGWIKGEPEYIEPETKQIRYGQITIHMNTAAEILENSGYAPGTYEAELSKRVSKIHTSGIANLNETVFVKSMLEDTSMTQEEQEILTQGMELVGSNRSALLLTAASLLGKVPYLFGGKSTKAGYDTSWWTYENGKQKGLDCSGYVQWAFRTAGYPDEIWQRLLSTGSILANATEITEEELIPGDLGLLNYGGTTNHVGIYLGNGYWIHCSSTGGTVVINDFQFHVFMRVEGIDDALLLPEVTEDLRSIPYTKEELSALSAYVYDTCRGDGVNAWILCVQSIKEEAEETTLADVLETKTIPDQETEPSEDMLRIVQMVLDGYTYLDPTDGDTNENTQG